MIVPLLAGVTEVTALHLHPDAARQESPEIVAAALVGDDWEVDLGNVASGRWWPQVHAVKGGAPYSYPWPNVHLDLPVDDRLVVTPETLAVSARIPLPLTPDRRARIVDVILDAQSDVEAHLNRPIVPRLYTERHLDDFASDWQFTLNDGDPIIRVVTVVPEPRDGLYTVTYLSGLDARTDPALRPIQRYILAHAKNSPEFTDLWVEATGAKGTVKSLTAQGQSVTFDKPTLGGGGGKPGDGAPGSLPTLASLDYWRKRSVYQGPSRWQEPVP